MTSTPMELKTIRFDVDAGVATITLARPERLNAWTGRMHTEYRWAIARAEADDAVRVVVVTGEGRGFCAGADTRALRGHVERGGYDPGTDTTLATPGYGVSPEFDHDFAFHFGLSTPVIAAINGPVAGVGLVLACYCDLRFAAAGAKFTTAHGKLNLPAEYGLSWLLPRLIGLTRANDLLLSSRTFLAEEAAAMGLVNAVVEPDELLPHTYRYALDLARTVSRGSLAATKRQIYLDQFRGLGESVTDAAVRLDQMMGQPDYAEGRRRAHREAPPELQLTASPSTSSPASSRAGDTGAGKSRAARVSTQSCPHRATAGATSPTLRNNRLRGSSELDRVTSVPATTGANSTRAVPRTSPETVAPMVRVSTTSSRCTTKRTR